MTTLPLSDGRVIKSVQRSLDCLKGNIHVDMKRGLSVLSTVASTAPFVGLMGTVLGIMKAFRGYSGPPAVVLAAIADGISEALVTTAAGLLVAVPAAWSYNYFVNKTHAFDIETENSSLELVNYLVIHQGKRRQAATKLT